MTPRLRSVPAHGWKICVGGEPLLRYRHYTPEAQTRERIRLYVWALQPRASADRSVTTLGKRGLRAWKPSNALLVTVTIFS
jgi:hypothetical protein